MQLESPEVSSINNFVSIPQAVWIACNKRSFESPNKSIEVSIPQAVWIACNFQLSFITAGDFMFQYRKRYGLHAITSALLTSTSTRRFNTASGMDCMQYVKPEDVDADAKFQYRKRYGLHAIGTLTRYSTSCSCFNTASGMDCMQFCEFFVCHIGSPVSIPQAVWIACNQTRWYGSPQRNEFQYRKRYGLHAIRRSVFEHQTHH